MSRNSRASEDIGGLLSPAHGYTPVHDLPFDSSTNSSRFLEGTAELFRKSGLSGWEEPFAKLKGQVAEYDALLRSEVLPSSASSRTPGQAPSFFVGYSRLMELRTDAERWLGDRFDRKTYHDFLLAQGLLSPALLRKTVLEQLVPAQLGTSAEQAHLKDH